PSTSPTFLSRLLPPPPYYKLFPYTTLFRSIEPIDGPAAKQAAIGPECRERGDHFARSIERQRALRHQPLRLGVRRDDGHLACRLDRKSTRLNSSHRTISYAVFCLKKKNKQN